MAINTTQLRIGNYLLAELQDWIVSQVCAIGGYDVTMICDSVPYELENLKPIELTEQWLLMFGFEKVNHIHGYSFYHHKKSKIDVYETKTVWMGQYINNHCKYVHQLQNLYFALTGTELEIVRAVEKV